MGDLEPEEVRRSLARRAAWRRELASVDWSAAGVGAPEQWDPGLVMALELMGRAASPMVLLLGERGVSVANPITLDLFGEAVAGGINGRPIGEVMPDSVAFFEAVLAAAATGTGVCHRQQPIRLLSDGRPMTRWFDLAFTPIVDTGGEVVATLGVAAEVTDHVHRLRALSESEQRLRLALEGSGMVGVWTLHVASNVTTADAAVARMYGLDAAVCAGGIDDTAFVEAVHPGDRSRVRATLERSLTTGAAYRCRYRVTGGDEPRWVITSGKPVFSEVGRVERLLGVVVDVTDQMETASALAESRFQFETLTEALPQIVWSSDAEGHHDYFSARWSEFTGITRDEITEHTWKELVDPQHWPMVSQVWDEARRTGQPYDLDYRFRHHSGEYRWLRVMALPIRDDSGQITRWFGTSTDVHNAYLLAEERERLATEDQLTQVLTRRALLTRAEAALDRAAPTASSLLMLDVDHFKLINDTFGHPAGDQVLSAVAARIKAAVGDGGLIGRLGGEEFAVLLAATASLDAMRIAELIRTTIAGHPVTLEDGTTCPVTVSIGIATQTPNGKPLSRLLSLADEALYVAKAAGRNQTRSSMTRDTEATPPA